jgi:hypothetical protein
MTTGCTQYHFLRRSFLILSIRAHTHAVCLCAVHSVLKEKTIASTSNFFVAMRVRTLCHLQQLFNHRNNLVSSVLLA